MQPHQQRVVDEKKELDDKLTKLMLFLTGKVYLSLAPEEQKRLQDQSKMMAQYSSILGARIAAF